MSGLPAQTKRSALIDRFRELGYTGPHGGTGKHPQFMQRGAQVVKLPNPHGRKKDIGRELLSRILRNAGISNDEWTDGL